jgi:THO complex subunit 2
MGNLKAELKAQMDITTSVLQALEQTKDSWFEHLKEATLEEMKITIQSFFQYCLLPRCMSSDPDALFCAKFVELVHNLNTPNFSTILFFKNVILLFPLCFIVLIAFIVV